MRKAPDAPPGIAQHPGAHDEDGGGQPHEEGQGQYHQEDAHGEGIDDGGLAQLDDAGGDEGHHAGVHPPQGVLHHGDVRKVGQAYGDDRDDEDGGGDDPQGGQNAPGQPLIPIADEGGGVHGDDTGGTLADGVVIGQVRVGGPVLFLHDLPLENGQHSIAAAKGAHADLGEGKIQVPQQFHGVLPLTR